MACVVEELNTGVVVYQVTDEPELKDNIYCERSYCSPDSSFFIYQRHLPGDSPVYKTNAEIVACEFGSWDRRVIARGHSYPEVSREGSLFHARPCEGGVRQLVRVDLASGEAEDRHVDGGVRPFTGMTISPGERRLAYGVPVGFDPQMFGVEVVDLQSGRKEVVCEDPYICNPHTQFDQDSGSDIMVQHNRGCEFDRDGNSVSNLGPEGCTLFAVNRETRERTPFLVGPPHTSSCTGHQQWIGRTREVLLSVSEAWNDGDREGNLLAAFPGLRPRVVTAGDGFCHIHASLCGRLFCCDVPARREIQLGSFESGRSVLLCQYGPDPEGAYKRYGQSSHAHAYLSPDLRWVVFNSCRTGRPEVHVASVPEAMLEELGIE